MGNRDFELPHGLGLLGGKYKYYMESHDILYHHFVFLYFSGSILNIPRDPGSPKLRMVARNLNVLCFSEVIVHPPIYPFRI